MTMSTSAMADQELLWVRAAQLGDTEAFRRLVDKYDRRVMYFILRFLSDADQALDVLQEVWLTLFRRLPTLREPRAFRVWLYQIAHDKVVSLIRRRRRQEELHDELNQIHRNSTNDNHELIFDQAELVHQALQRLRAMHREVLTLRFLEDMRLEEVAEALRLSVGTVKSRLHYAKQELRRHVEKLSNE